MSLEHIKRHHYLFMILGAVIILYIFTQYTSLFNRTASAAEYSENIVGEWVDKENKETITKYMSNGVFTTRILRDGSIEKTASGKWVIENGLLVTQGVDINTHKPNNAVRIIDTLNNTNLKLIDSVSNPQKKIQLHFLKRRK